MSLFKKSERELNARQQALAAAFAARFLRAQQRLATWLNRKAVSQRPGILYLILGLLGLAFGCFCLRLILVAIH